MDADAGDMTATAEEGEHGTLVTFYPGFNPTAQRDSLPASSTTSAAASTCPLMEPDLQTQQHMQTTVERPTVLFMLMSTCPL